MANGFAQTLARTIASTAPLGVQAEIAAEGRRETQAFQREQLAERLAAERQAAAERQRTQLFTNLLTTAIRAEDPADRKAILTLMGGIDPEATKAPEFKAFTSALTSGSPDLRAQVADAIGSADPAQMTRVLSLAAGQIRDPKERFDAMEAILGPLSRRVQIQQIEGGVPPGRPVGGTPVTVPAGAPSALSPSGQLAAMLEEAERGPFRRPDVGAVAPIVRAAEREALGGPTAMAAPGAAPTIPERAPAPSITTRPIPTPAVAPAAPGTVPAAATGLTAQIDALSQRKADIQRIGGPEATAAAAALQTRIDSLRERRDRLEGTGGVVNLVRGDTTVPVIAGSERERTLVAQGFGRGPVERIERFDESAPVPRVITGLLGLPPMRAGEAFERGIALDVSDVEARELSRIGGTTKSAIRTARTVARSVRGADLAGRPELLGTAGRIATGLKGFVSQLEGLTRLLSPENAGVTVRVLNPDQDPLDPTNRLYDTVFARAGIGAQAAEIRSLFTDLAFTVAKSFDPGGRISDQDMLRAFETIGGNLGDPGAVDRVLDSVVNRLELRFSDRLTERLGAAPERVVESDRSLRQHFGPIIAALPQETMPAADKAVVQQALPAIRAGTVSPEVAERLSTSTLQWLADNLVLPR